MRIFDKMEKKIVIAIFFWIFLDFFEILNMNGSEDIPI